MCNLAIYNFIHIHRQSSAKSKFSLFDCPGDPKQQNRAARNNSGSAVWQTCETIAEHNSDWNGDFKRNLLTSETKVLGSFSIPRCAWEGAEKERRRNESGSNFHLGGQSGSASRTGNRKKAVRPHLSSKEGSSSLSSSSLSFIEKCRLIYSVLYRRG